MFNYISARRAGNSISVTSLAYIDWLGFNGTFSNSSYVACHSF